MNSSVSAHDVPTWYAKRLIDERVKSSAEEKVSAPLIVIIITHRFKPVAVASS